MVILYNPPSSAQRKTVLPMSLLALGALLEGEHEYTIVDGNLEPDPVRAISRALGEAHGGILGVTVMPGPQVRHAASHSRQLKASHTDLTIVWGGYFPTQHYEVCLRADYVDYVVRGHGDLVFRTLIHALERDEDVTTLPGLAYRNPESGEVRANGVAPVPDPNKLPDFPYHRLDVARYARRTFMGERTVAHHSSYGCPFFCDFCAVVSMVDGRWKAQSAERTAAATRRLVDSWGADAVEFYDNNFFVREARTAGFAERIMDLDIGWWGEARIDTVLDYSNQTWELMRDSGLKMMFMGAESGSDETLKRMNKGTTASAEKTLALAEKMRHYDIVPEYSFVLGCPPDPETDVRETIALIRKVKAVNPATEIVLYLYTPVPSSGDLYEGAKAEGFEFPETLDEWVSTDWQAFSRRHGDGIPWLSESLVQRARNFERVIHAHYPTVTDPGLLALWRWTLRAVSAWRYRLQFYDCPFELRMLQRLLAYERPETSGF